MLAKTFNAPLIILAGVLRAETAVHLWGTFRIRRKGEACISHRALYEPVWQGVCISSLYLLLFIYGTFDVHSGFCYDDKLSQWHVAFAGHCLKSTKVLNKSVVSVHLSVLFVLSYVPFAAHFATRYYFRVFIFLYHSMLVVFISILQ